MTLLGHFWTVYPTAREGIAPLTPPTPRPWSTRLEDPDVGTLTLRGALHVPDRSRTCLVLVHGLGGTVDAFYCKAAANAAARAGVASLRIALRGADRLGEDFYHGGLVDDLAAALQSPDLAPFDHLIVMGFSLGGHMVLRYALAPDEPRLRAVAAICPPLHLGRTAEAIHRVRSIVYERVILAALLEIYAAVAKRRRVPAPVARVACARSLREYDALTVVPRFGFRDPDDYYDQVSVGPHLDRLAVPALIVHSDADPMIPPDTYDDLWAAQAPKLTWRRTALGGHVGFPPRGVDLGLQTVGQTLGQTVEAQALGWLLASLPARA